VRTADVSALADEERCIGWVRLALGAPDLAIEIENVQNWVALADSAAEYRRGNVFIAGDAAHTMPPAGGFGGNTGVQDAHNLAWKIAAVLDGSAGEALLSGDPGTRAPHVWLGDGRSTLDLFGDGFVLLSAGGDPWRHAAGAAAAELGIEVHEHEVGAEDFAAAYSLGSDGATLVRPDGVRRLARRVRGRRFRRRAVLRAARRARALTTVKALPPARHEPAVFLGDLGAERGTGSGEAPRNPHCVVARGEARVSELELQRDRLQAIAAEIHEEEQAEVVPQHGVDSIVVDEIAEVVQDARRDAVEDVS
jgi:hypothetical protein